MLESRKRKKGRPKNIDPMTMKYISLAVPKDLLVKFDHLMIDNDINIRWKMIEILINSYKTLKSNQDYKESME